MTAITLKLSTSTALTTMRPRNAPEQLIDGRDVELWEHARRIATFDSKLE
jgi:hypothetical protein